MGNETDLQHPAFKQTSEIMEDIVMENEVISQKNITFGDCKVVIQLPKGEDASDSVVNNIVCFKSGKVFWEIKDLLECYARKNHINYFYELYFDIFKENDKILTCIGFYNHCVIDVFQKKILSIINNR